MSSSILAMPSEVHSLVSLAANKSDLETAEKKEDQPPAMSPRKPHYPTWQWLLSLVGIYLGALLYGLDTTIAADIQAAVYDDFGDIRNLAWIGLGFPLGSVACILVVGDFYTLMNTKTLINVSIVIFEIGSAICGAAPNMPALIVGRIVAGLGGCGMYMGALTFLNFLGAPEKLFLYNALIGVTWGTGAILGPVIGGAFAVSSASWRWAFYINLPLAALLAPVYLFVTPSFNPRPDLSLGQKIRKIDWLGTVLNAGVFVIGLVAIAFSGSSFAWNSPASITLWTVWGVTLSAFAVQQGMPFMTTTANRLFPVHFLASKEMVLLFIATACAATANAVTLYYIPLFFGFTRGDTALQSAVRLLPFITVFISFVLFSGASLPFVARYAPYYTIGGILITAGAALLISINHNTSTAKIYVYEILVAAGSGLTFQNAYAVAAAKTEDQDKTKSIGFINVSQIGVTALSLAIASSVYQNVGIASLRDALSPFGPLPGSVLQQALAGASSEALATAPPAVVQVAVHTIANVISKIFSMNLAAGALMTVVSLLMNQSKTNMKQEMIGGG